MNNGNAVPFGFGAQVAEIAIKLSYIDEHESPPEAYVERAVRLVALARAEIAKAAQKGGTEE